MNKVKKFSPYLGQVHLDYHPEKENHLATASGHKDKQICVYELLSDCKQSIMTLTHSEPVSSIQWRPKRPTQLTATGINLLFMCLNEDALTGLRKIGIVKILIFVTAC